MCILTLLRKTGGHPQRWLSRPRAGKYWTRSPPCRLWRARPILFKEFGNVDASPFVWIPRMWTKLSRRPLTSTHLWWINLKILRPPRCFEIEERLQGLWIFRFFHDDQHGTAIVVASGLINAMKWWIRPWTRCVWSQWGRICRTAYRQMLLAVGFVDIVMVDRDGVLYKGKSGMPAHMHG